MKVLSYQYWRLIVAWDTLLWNLLYLLRRSAADFLTCHRKSSGVTKMNNSVLFKCPTKWGHCSSEPTCTVLKMKQEMDLNHRYTLLKCLPFRSSIALVPWYKNGTFRIWFKVISPRLYTVYTDFRSAVSSGKSSLCKCMYVSIAFGDLSSL